ncbi:MAG TPA: phage portal protein [Phycisphaerae bacterium]|nr:phage portal protein [Phycisphaerae bacterium]
MIRGGYDAAQTTDDNRRHWANADSLSAAAANSLDVRKRVRERARYEAANNCYLNGMVQTLANDCIGIGPQLQMLTKDQGLNDRLEEAFKEWAEAVHLAAKLRTMRYARAVDGEVFAVLTTNRKVTSEIKLDLQLVECDRVTSPWLAMASNDVDGIRFDTFGNPISYCIFRSHPGDLTGDLTFDWQSAEYVIHWFKSTRPGQQRGISEIMPALPLSAILRRYTIAVLEAAETAANFAAVLQTDAPADAIDDADDPAVTPATPWSLIELERRMATVLPEGWKLGQMTAQQPTTTYPEFTRAIINEMARCVLEPRNIATGDSSDYNYASGRMDHQTYHRSIQVDQDDAEELVIDRILSAWVAEAAARGLLPAAGLVPHTWFWRGPEHVDPLKEANAQAVRLKNGTTTLADEHGRQGNDWQKKRRQRAIELAYDKKLEQEFGISFAEQPAGQAPPETDDRKDDEQ